MTDKEGFEQKGVNWEWSTVKSAISLWIGLKLPKTSFLIEKTSNSRCFFTFSSIPHNLLIDWKTFYVLCDWLIEEIES